MIRKGMTVLLKGKIKYTKGRNGTKGVVGVQFMDAYHRPIVFVDSDKLKIERKSRRKQ